MDDTSLVELYKSQLETSTDPGSVLFKMLCTLTGNKYMSDVLFQIKRLVKIYGVQNIFFSILDCSEVEVIDNSPYRLIAYFAKKRLEKKKAGNPEDVIDVTKIKKRIDKQKGVEPPPPLPPRPKRDPVKKIPKLTELD